MRYLPGSPLATTPPSTTDFLAAASSTANSILTLQQKVNQVKAALRIEDWIGALVGEINPTGFKGDGSQITGISISSIGGLAAGIATWLGSPSSANLLSAQTDKTGTGLLCFATSPTLTTPNLGTPSALVGTNVTGLPASATNSGVFAAARIPTLDLIPTAVANVGLGSQRIVSLADPVGAQDAVTLNYLSNQLSLLDNKADVQGATVVALAAATYNNGASGVGATLTLNVAAVLVLDGYTPALNDRVLIKNQASAFQNGIFSVTTLGTVLIQAVLTRTTDFDQASDGVNGAMVYVLNGTANGNTLWNCTTSGSITMGTTNINWSKFLGSTYTADEASLHLTGTTFSILSTWAGQSAIATVGTLTGGATGTGFTVALGTSTITGILGSANGGTGNGFTKFSGPASSEKTFTLPNASATVLTDTAAVTVAQGGSGRASTTAYAVICGGTTSTAAEQSIASVGTVPSLLASNGAGALPTFQTPAAVIGYIRLEDQKSSGTNGGTNTTGSYQTRTLNTKCCDTNSDCTLSSNTFTLTAGTYEIEAVVPAYGVDNYTTQLYNTTDSAIVTDVNSVAILGTPQLSANSRAITNFSVLCGRFIIAASKALAIQMKSTTQVATFGYGVAAGFSVEVYTQVILRRVA